MRMERRPFSAEENERLVAAVLSDSTKGRQGNPDWVAIARRVGGHRTGKQCRERWLEHGDPTINKEPFSVQVWPQTLPSQLVTAVFFQHSRPIALAQACWWYMCVDVCM